MSGSNRVVILGGHGKVALLATTKLRAAGYSIDSVIRNPAHSGDVKVVGGNPVVLDIEMATVEELAAVFSGAKAIVFSAGAGGGNPDRTRAVDYEAAVRAMQAADQAGVKRFVMVSFASVDSDYERIDPNDSFYPYVKAKHDADAQLRKSQLDYTILGPGGLTLEPASKKVAIADFEGNIKGRDLSRDEKITSRDNVAEMITHVIAGDAAIRETVNFYDGDTPITDAVR